VNAPGAAPLWAPSPGRAAGTLLAAFAARQGHTGYEALHRWSVAAPDEFWAAVWEHCGVRGERGGPVVEPPGPGGPWWHTRFFPDARLNVAENLLGDPDGRVAVVFRAEDRLRTEWTREDLHALVSRLQQALSSWGVGPGDRVAAWLPNLPETLAVMLAAASVGAVFSSCSTDFGAAGVLDRFAQVRPTVLFATDRCLYGGAEHDCLERLDAIRAGLPTVDRTVLVPYLGAPADPLPAPTLEEVLAPFPAAPVRFEPLPFDHPWVVLFSSGTTGVPKCIVHRAGGVLLKHLVEHQLHADVRPGDRVLYFTTTGWMMWNWLTSALASDATIVCYDGSPSHPGPDALFRLAAEERVTLFGTSAKFVDAVRSAGFRPRDEGLLATVRTVCSTGSTLLPEGFTAVQGDWNPDVHLASISGGTDLCGCLVGGDPTSPVWAGEIQRPALGMDIDVLADDGTPCPPGVQGELVCRSAFPSIPLGFEDDPDDRRFRAAYFDRFPGAWHQGDYAEWTIHGGVVIHGRSDATLNAGGVRIGTAELYRPVERLPEVVEALAVAQAWEGDTRIVLFVRLAPGAQLDDALRDRIRAAIRTAASPRHVPARIVSVADLPRTRSNKLAELAVRAVVHGRPVDNVEALANPEALQLFRDLPELRT
jgi:acetoacetyl-CoA synthetase